MGRQRRTSEAERSRSRGSRFKKAPGEADNSGFFETVTLAPREFMAVQLDAPVLDMDRAVRRRMLETDFKAREARKASASPYYTMSPGSVLSIRTPDPEAPPVPHPYYEPDRFAEFGAVQGGGVQAPVPNGKVGAFREVGIISFGVRCGESSGEG